LINSGRKYQTCFLIVKVSMEASGKLISRCWMEYFGCYAVELHSVIFQSDVEIGRKSMTGFGVIGKKAFS
jgi:hypothetical protein